MNYDASMRKQIKAYNKGVVKSRLGACIGILFLYALPFFLVFSILYGLMFSTIFGTLMANNGAMMASDAMADPNNFSTQTFQQITQLSNSSNLLQLLLILLTSPLTYGLYKFYLGLSRGESPTVGIIFKPFTSLHSYWVSLKMYCCIAFRYILWCLVPSTVLGCATFGLIISAFSSSSYGGQPSSGAIAIFIIILILVCLSFIPISVKIATYTGGYAIVNDDEYHGVWDATRLSSSAFKGHFVDLLVFYLSFIPWYLLEFAIMLVPAILISIGIWANSAVATIILGILSVIIIIVGMIILGAFISAYVTSSYFSLYEYFAADAFKQESIPYYHNNQAGNGYPPQQPPTGGTSSQQQNHSPQQPQQDIPPQQPQQNFPPQQPPTTNPFSQHPSQNTPQAGEGYNTSSAPVTPPADAPQQPSAPDDIPSTDNRPNDNNPTDGDNNTDSENNPPQA